MASVLAASLGVCSLSVRLVPSCAVAIGVGCVVVSSRGLGLVLALAARCGTVFQPAELSVAVVEASGAADLLF
jgi:hypothetical protein